MGRFGQSLLNETDPPILGLDESVLIPPRRLHFTLGVMSLASTPPTTNPEGTTGPLNQPRTIDDAVRLLENLKPRIDDILRVSATGSAGQAREVRVTLNSMDVMKLEKGSTAHVLWVGPKDGNSKNIADEGTNKFRQVCGTSCSNKRAEVAVQLSPSSDFIRSSFKEAGFLVEDNRPLKVCPFISFILFALCVVVKIRLRFWDVSSITSSGHFYSPSSSSIVQSSIPCTGNRSLVARKGAHSHMRTF
jgi:activating signal cointegrator complex subunit 1